MTVIQLHLMTTSFKMQSNMLSEPIVHLHESPILVGIACSGRQGGMLKSPSVLHCLAQF